MSNTDYKQEITKRRKLSVNYEGEDNQALSAKFNSSEY